jgi:hypothetical protein
MDRSVSTAPAGADRTRLSSLLLLDATARKDNAAWQRLARRHLEVVEPGNGSLAYKYAYSLFDSGDAAGAARWADTAIVSKASGATGRASTQNAYKLRVAIAQQSGDSAEVLRVAQDWFSWARASGADTAGATAACASAGGTCE